jgi:hypothetical protein
MMNTFEAINRAADHIEQHPALYSFTHARTPSRTCPLGCMLGRIGEMLKMAPGTDVAKVARDYLRVPEGAFYERIWNLMDRPRTGSRALNDVARVPAAMRAYAKRYHGRAGIPDSVRDIFSPTAATAVALGETDERIEERVD